MNKLQVFIKYTLMIASIGVLIISCSGTEDDEMPRNKIEADLSGNAQKGPFLNGSSIAISELDESFSPTGNDFNTQIIDNSGLFQINGIELATNYVTLRVDGFYFNEVCGESSNSQITLNGIADVSQSDFKNLNVITHLEKARVEFLITEGMDFNAAKRQAQEEVLSIFNVSANIESSEELDIAGNSDGDAILIAISSILQGYRSESEFSDLLANIITDIRTDGTLDSESIGASLVSHTKLLNAEDIADNIESRYAGLGVNVTVPAFEPILNNFLQETAFPSNEPAIEYPESGDSGTGINILAASTTEINSGSFFNLSANLPNECLNFEIKIISEQACVIEEVIEVDSVAVLLLHGPTWGYSSGSVQGWSVGTFSCRFDGTDTEAPNQLFTATAKANDLHIQFDPGSFIIEFYVNHGTEPIQTKRLVVN